MDPADLERIDACAWRIPATGAMRVPAIIYANEMLIRAMDDKVREQVSNVASLPGIVGASYAMPDAHWGYGFPIGGVAAFDPELGGVVSAGGVGFDISCGVRTLTTGLARAEVDALKLKLADGLFHKIPVGLGAGGTIQLDPAQLDHVLTRGAHWAVKEGYGLEADLARIEECGMIGNAWPDAVSERAKARQHNEMGTLGSGNHYLEVQEVAEVFDPVIARGYSLVAGQVVVSIHCGSRGLGHQIGTEYLRDMALAASTHGIVLPDRELACAPIASVLGQRYLGAMRAAVNCALANRQIITHLTRTVFAKLFPRARLELLYDVSHNTCKLETHRVDNKKRRLLVHRKGATRAIGPGHVELPDSLRPFGQPVLIGGSMGTASYVMAGTAESEKRAWSSACHGAGRAMSRHAALRVWRGRDVVDALANEGIIVRSPSARGVAEEAPGAYKDVTDVVNAAESAELARKVARLQPIICIKG